MTPLFKIVLTCACITAFTAGIIYSVLTREPSFAEAQHTNESWSDYDPQE